MCGTRKISIGSKVGAEGGIENFSKNSRFANHHKDGSCLPCGADLAPVKEGIWTRSIAYGANGKGLALLIAEEPNTNIVYGDMHLSSKKSNP
jgi:hypothetical protein